jgi:hypothetical protein
MSTGDFSKRNCGAKFSGCYAMDQLQNIEPKEGAGYVANTDDANESGVHWICCYFGKDVTAYMDSYGAPPPQRMANFMRRGGKPIIYSNVQIQSLDSDVCGQHCCALLRKLSKCTGAVMPTFNEHVYGFSLHDYEANDLL